MTPRLLDELDGMHIGIVGSGGREDGLAWKAAQSPLVAGIRCYPGNPGMASRTLVNGCNPVCVDIPATSIEAILDDAVANGVKLIIPGPEEAFFRRIVDIAGGERYMKAGLRVWGPNRKAAEFEASKAFAQKFMQEFGVACAKGEVFDQPAEAKAYAKKLGGRCVVKPDGNTLGKGVQVCRTMEEAEDAINRLMVKREYGDAGAVVVIQELLEGKEMSVHVLCDANSEIIFPIPQDYKQSGEGDTGKNTGGMGGTLRPESLSFELEQMIRERIIKPWREGCRKRGIVFRGMLFIGIMLTSGGPKVLEFNVRFGDPETQLLMPVLRTDLIELLWASVNDRLSEVTVGWAERCVACVVEASKGYPDAYEKGKVIAGLDAVLPQDSAIFHAGTKQLGNSIVTNGGRVLGVTVWRKDLREALSTAYAILRRVSFEGGWHRWDIGYRDLT